LRSAPFGQSLEEFAIYLNDRGHAIETMRLYVWAADEFVRWLASLNSSLDAIDARLVDLFLNEAETNGSSQSPASKPRKNLRSGLNQFLKMLQQRGHVSDKGIEQTSPIDMLMVDYGHFLSNVAGLSESTCRYRTNYGREFLHHHFGDGPIHWDRLQARDVYEFVVEIGFVNRPRSGSVLASSIRSILRWAQLQGYCSSSLALAVPNFSRHSKASLPKVMTDDQLRTFLEHFDRTTPIGCRNYAMALCQTHLGMRVGEVVALELDDIDWRSGTIRIVGGKARRERLLPLTDRVGGAISGYLRHGRPVTSCRNVFLRHTVPLGSPVTRYLISHVFRHAFSHVEGCEDWTGTHVLRHTAATRMYGRGATLKEIGDILGHRQLNSTGVYTRIERSQLAVAAMPWPKENQL
jgi:site-specific recombinase XerD